MPAAPSPPSRQLQASTSTITAPITTATEATATATTDTTTVHNISDSDSSAEKSVAEVYEPVSPTYSLIGHYNNQGSESAMKPVTPDIDVLKYSPFNQQDNLDPEFVTFAEQNAIEIIGNVTEEYRKEAEGVSGPSAAPGCDNNDKNKQQRDNTNSG